MPCKPNMPAIWAWRHDPNKSFISFLVIGLGLVAWTTKYGLIISFNFKSIRSGMGLMDNESLNSKQIFVELKSSRDGLSDLAVQLSV